MCPRITSGQLSPQLVQSSELAPNRVINRTRYCVLHSPLDFNPIYLVILSRFLTSSTLSSMEFIPFEKYKLKVKPNCTWLVNLGGRKKRNFISQLSIPCRIWLSPMLSWVPTFLTCLFFCRVSGSPGSGLQLLGRELHPAYRLPPHMEYLYSLQHSTANSIHGKFFFSDLDRYHFSRFSIVLRAVKKYINVSKPEHCAVIFMYHRRLVFRYILISNKIKGNILSQLDSKHGTYIDIIK